MNDDGDGLSCKSNNAFEETIRNQSKSNELQHSQQTAKYIYSEEHRSTSVREK